jgi:hypothetical protein
LLQILLQLVFPKTNCSYLFQPEELGDLPMALAIALDLCCPKRLMGLRDVPASFTPVPKAPIYENREFRGIKIEIGLSRQSGMKRPSGDSGSH